MEYFDWIIVGVFIVTLFFIAYKVQGLSRSVSDYLAAGRSAGRYLLTVSDGMANVGAITIVANFEKFYVSGFGGAWWQMMFMPILMVIALSGFVIRRYRETRALTMAQFFEIRYSKYFRLFSGILIFLSGILNYGIFPGITARFIIYFTGLPQELQLGSLTVPTLIPVMLIMLTSAVLITTSGGQIAVMVTDFFQGQVIQITVLLVLFVLATMVNWTDLITGLQQVPVGQSRINPFDQGDISGFNLTFFLMLIFVQIYATRCWQGSQGNNAAAKTPHEARMAGILGAFRGQVLVMLNVMLPLIVFAVLHHSKFSEPAGVINRILGAIENPQIQKQMTVPVGLSVLLPIGIRGLLTAVIFAAAISTDTTYLHSWGSIFVQDVVLPFRKKPLSPKKHIWLLRGAVVGVACFAFIFSLLFPLNDYIQMYFQITAAIFTGGAGAVVIGGLYWKKGSVEGAWAALVGGALLATTGIVARNIIWPQILPGLREGTLANSFFTLLPEKFPWNGMQMAFFTALASAGLYVVFSLLSRREPVNMDKLLHRGDYRIAADHQINTSKGTSNKLLKFFGIGQEFTRGDRFIYFFQISWILFYAIIFIMGTVVQVFIDIPEIAWIRWWAVYVIISLLLAIGTTIWFLIGGCFDIKSLVHILKTPERNIEDDGTVHQDEHLQEK